MLANARPEPDCGLILFRIIPNSIHSVRRLHVPVLSLFSAFKQEEGGDIAGEVHGQL